ncbi:MAG: hypothetical protein ACXVXL_30485 [Solirubrobacteraceae bacterium]
MVPMRRPRTDHTEDLSATLRSVGRACVVGRVLNVSDGGMLVAGSDLDVGETASLELVGPGFRFAGLATVAHRTDRAVDLRFLSWEGQAYRAICALIAARLPRQLVSGGAGRRDPHRLRRLVVFTGIERPMRPALAVQARRSR